MYTREPEPLALLLLEWCPDFPHSKNSSVRISHGLHEKRIDSRENLENCNFSLQSTSMKKHYIIGIDEAGRWPWAWPIVAWGWMADVSLASGLLSSLEGLDDSKLLSSKKHERLFAEIERMQHRNECQYAFSYRDAETIDLIGIRESNRECMQDVLLSLLQFVDSQDSLEVFIDGCDNYRFDIGEMDIGYDFRKLSKEKQLQNSMTGRERIQIIYKIWWDRSVPAISAASIIAKVTRDHIMCDFHEDFPHYGFASHKGYGTRKHQESLLHYGITPLHRKSYAPVKRLISLTSSL